MAKNTVVVSVLGDTAPLAKSFGTVGKLAAGITVAAAGIATALGVKAVRSASKLEQALGGLGSVFKGATPQMQKFATAAADTVGLAQSDYAQLATVLGSQLKNMGVATDQLGTKTNELVTLGADLAAQFGGSTADAVGALSSLLRGERDPIERYGVSINEARIQAQLAEMGLKGLTGEALTQAKTQATLALLYQQTADAQGAFSRESMTLAGQQERLRAGTENLYAALGTALLPAATAVTGVLAKLVNTVQSSDAFAAFTQGLTSASTAFQNFIIGVLNGDSIDVGSMFTGILDAAVAGITNAADWLATGGAATIVNGIVNGRAALFDAAFSVFPAILEALVAAIPAIVTGVVALVTQLAGMLVTQAPVILAGAVQLFTGLLQALVQILPALIAGVVALLPPLITTLLGMIPTLLNAAVDVFTALVDALPEILPPLVAAIVDLLPVVVETVLGMIPKILDAAIDLFTALVEAIPKILPLLITAIITLLPRLITTIVGMIPQILQAAIRLFTGLVTAIPKVLPALIKAVIGMIPQLVTAIIGMVPELVQAGIDLVRGLIEGIVSMGGAIIEAIGGVVSGAIDWAKQLLGIKSPSRVFREIGQFVGAGFAIGLRRSSKDVQDAAEGMIDKIRKGMDAGAITLKAGAATADAIRATTAQIKNALNARDKVLDRLAIAKDRLQGLIADRADFVASVKDSVKQLGSIAGLTTVKDMVTNLQDQVAAAAKFRVTLDRLAKLGLDATTRDQLMQQFLSDGSTASADALLAGGKQAVQRVANLQKQLAKQGEALGQNVGDKMYKAGIDAARGLVNGLTAQAANLDKVAAKLADALVRTVKQKLGIKSPSRVLAEVGEWTVKGFARGIDKTQALAVRSMGRLSDAVVGGFDPQLGGPTLAVAGAPASAAGPGRGNIYKVEIHSLAPSAEVGRSVLAAIRSYEETVAVPVVAGTVID